LIYGNCADESLNNLKIHENYITFCKCRAFYQMARQWLSRCFHLSQSINCEFINEIGMISALQHPCLVKLYGCYVEGDQLLLVYEYMENNSLAQALFGK